MNLRLLLAVFFSVAGTCYVDAGVLREQVEVAEHRREEATIGILQGAIAGWDDEQPSQTLNQTSDPVGLGGSPTSGSFSMGASALPTADIIKLGEPTELWAVEIENAKLPPCPVLEGRLKPA